MKMQKTIKSILAVIVVLVMCGSAWAGSALDFDGDNDYVTVPDEDNLDFGATDSFSISVWIRISQELTSSAIRIVDKRRWESYPVYGIYREGYNLNVYQNKASFGIEDVSDNGLGISGNTTINEGDWYHIVAVRDTTTDSLYLYVDGLPDASPVTDVTTSSLETSWDFNIGRYKAAEPGPEYRHFPGKIDEVAIYDRALTATEIEDIYHCGVIIDSNLVGYWDFEEGAGQVAYDSSGNGNDGQLGSDPNADASDPVWVESEVPGVTYHVDGATGDNTDDGLTRETAFATIQRGINVAQDCDTVLVWPGVYNEEIGFWGDAITVKSAADAAVVETDYGYAFSLFSAEGPNTVLSNFIIRDSQYGIYLVNGSSPTISNLTIVDNDFGILAYGGADPDIRNCIFWGNSSGDLFRDPPLAAQYSFVQDEVDANLVAYWKLDGDATDSAGDNDGTIYGATTTTGQVGDALDFDGSGDYVEIPDNDSLNPSQEISLSFWIYNRGGQNAGIHKSAGCPSEPASPGNSRSYQIWIVESTGLVKLRIHESVSNPDDLDSISTVPLNEWHHIAATFNQGDAAIYIDGQLDNSGTMSVSSIMNDAQPIMIGAQWFFCGTDHLVDQLNGSIDDVRIYDKALSTDQIMAMYEAGLAGHEYGPLFADANNNDYHLLSERGRYWPLHDVWVLDDVSSPCIDGGDPNVNPSNERTPNGGRINMGAYGDTAYASMSEWALRGDINLDGIVNFLDFAIVAEDWLSTLPWAE